MENKFVKWFLGFFDNSPDGGSMRKLVAVWFMVLITLIHGKYLRYTISGKQEADFEFAGTLFYIDVVMVGLLLSLIMAEQLFRIFAIFRGRDIEKELPKEEEKKPE
jgi:hypothetical protein